ncbi:MAG: sarcosine oxidase subunit delta [Rhodobacteraceae bacterium]|nr:MAG: sarcosine oxidase subunit delta [Paracoccaceae bacterium]
MLKFKCPYCQFVADETELVSGGEAHITRELGSSSEKDFADYLFYRKNPRGVHFERWLHQFGCGKWFIAARCTLTMEVFGTYSAQTLKPPASIIRKIKSRRPDWKGFSK